MVDFSLEFVWEFFLDVTVGMTVTLFSSFVACHSWENEASLALLFFERGCDL